MEGAWYWRVNPFHWSRRTIRVFVSGFFLIMLPIYLYIGFQPTLSAEALTYPVLDVPSLNLNTPVAPLELTNHQLTAPNTIAGAYSQYEGKTLIIGHSSTVFRNLDQALPGSTLSYAEQSYRIQSSAIVAKSEIDMKDILASTGTDTIIIMTCAGEPLPDQDATHRLIITAIRE